MHRLLENALGVAGEKAVATSGGEPDLFGFEAGPYRQRLSNRPAARHTEAYGGKDAIDWVWDCVTIYAETAAYADYHFERDGKKLVANKKSTDPDEWGDAPADLSELFKAPADTVDYTELMMLSVIDFLLAGEFLWLKFQVNLAGKPTALYRLAPSLVEVEPGPTAPKAYIYRPPGGKEMTLQPEEVVHVRRPNPHDPFRGLGIIAGAPRVFDGDLAFTEQFARYYEGGTKLAGVLESDRSIPPATMAKLKEQWSRLYAGARNAHQVAALERGITFKPISATAEQAQFETVSQLSRDRICSMFRVPPVMLGFVGGSTDRQAVREAQRIFDNKTMRPFLNRLEDAISRGLTQAWGVDLKIDYEYVLPTEDALELAGKLGQMPGIRVRELREQAGLDPLGDERDDIVLNLPGLDDGTGHPDPNLPGEPGRPPVRARVPAFPQPGQPLPRTAAAQKALDLSIAELKGRLNGKAS